MVTPIQRLSLVFRLYFSRIINPQHELFGGRIVAATVVSLFGALALSVSDRGGAGGPAAAGRGARLR